MIDVPPDDMIEAANREMTHDRLRELPSICVRRAKSQREAADIIAALVMARGMFVKKWKLGEELDRWLAYATYCKVCALSAERPDDFDVFQKKH